MDIDWNLKNCRRKIDVFSGTYEEVHYEVGGTD